MVVGKSLLISVLLEVIFFLRYHFFNQGVMEAQLIGLSHREIVQIDRDYEKVAKSVKLLYVNDRTPGITRIRKGSGFAYLDAHQRVIKNDQLERIKKLAIPPAWTNVWICAAENGHIQATGYDIRKRKQYKYHALWNTVRNETKFHRLYEFGKALPLLRKRLEMDLSKRLLVQDKVLATVIRLMEFTYIRIGSEDYEKLYGSYGMTTLKDNHVKISGAEIKFSFVGKKSIAHNITLKNKRLARIVRQCRDIPGKELFQYYDENGNRHPIDSGMVNEYIRETMQADFTAKDFRTWAGTINLLRCFRQIGEPENDSQCKKNILKALDEVSHKLGNTRTVCRKYYVHPQLIHLYESNSLSGYLKDLPREPSVEKINGMAQDEQVLMRILKNLNS
jgi:DNA topoisomerase-1